MTPLATHKRARHGAPRGRRGASLLSLALAACALAPPAAQAARKGTSGSAYPSGVSRPLIRVLPGKAAHNSATANSPAASHGSVASHGSAASKQQKKKKAPKKPRKPVLRGNPARALRAFLAMQKYYYVQGTGLYAGEPFSYLWPFSQALAATVSMAGIPKMPVSFANELHTRLVGLRSYLDTN